MQRLIEDLLAFSRVGSRGGALVPVDLGNVADRVLIDLRVSIEESGALVTRDPLPTVEGDESQLTQVLLNLVSNALKFRGKAPPRVHLAASAVGDSWEITVADNGIGIDPQYFERIFVLFQRLHTREQYSGTGMGLAIARKIVERHRGRIWVESAPGEGSTFHFLLRGATPAV
jgi:light-regulated signal transduction histidine kinase (bacteriophytochrome)